MQIPSKVKIGGLVYDVEQTENLKMGPTYNGEIFYSDLKINLRPVSKAQTERAFIHEILHAIYDNLGYYDQDEKQIDELSGAIYALIVDNPKIF